MAQPLNPDDANPDDTRRHTNRRSFLKAAGGVTAAAAGATLLPSMPASAAPSGTAATASAAPRTGARPPRTPKVVRSREALGLTTPSSTLPITENGTTYVYAQEARWLDASHFAVGRWDGSMSIFEFETAPYQGPIIDKAVNDPGQWVVEMLTPLSATTIATSNDGSALSLWHAPGGDWTKLGLVGTYSFDPALGAASAGAAIGTPSTSSATATTLVVGHTNGFLSLWTFNSSTRTLTFRTSVNIQNPNPTNPFNDHTVEDVVVADSATGVVAAGCEDGYVTFLNAASGAILSQTVFNPSAQRGINAIAIRGNKLLLANCSVGPSDYNMWYYSINKTNWSISLLDKQNLIIDTSKPQVFNFDVVWGMNNGSPVWFASTEEGALWMGTPSATALNPIGAKPLTPPFGSALAYRNNHLVYAGDDLHQFSTT